MSKSVSEKSIPGIVLLVVLVLVLDFGSVFEDEDDDEREDEHIARNFQTGSKARFLSEAVAALRRGDCPTAD